MCSCPIFSISGLRLINKVPRLSQKFLVESEFSMQLLTPNLTSLALILTIRKVRTRITSISSYTELCIIWTWVDGVKSYTGYIKNLIVLKALGHFFSRPVCLSIRSFFLSYIKFAKHLLRLTNISIFSSISSKSRLLLFSRSISYQQNISITIFSRNSYRNH